MRVSAIILALSISAIAYPVQDSIEGDEILATEEESGDVCYEAKVIKSKSTVRHRRHSYHRKNPTSTLNTGAGSVTSTSIFSSITSASNQVSTGKGTSSSFKSDTSSSIVASPASTRLTSASSTTSPSLTASPSLTTSARLTTSASSTTSSSLTPSPSSTAFSPSSTTSSPSLTTSPSLKTSASQSISRTTTNTSSTAYPTQSAQPVALRGVNIGHWLVIEPWMDDGILMSGKFKNAPDQWTFDSLDTDGSYIKQHWDTWFTQGDAQRLKNYGFNALRIPIGYWAFNNENTPFRKGAMEYMDKAIVWARNIGMKVMIDCHGSPGSQNGQMHSGHQDAVQWQQGSNLNLSTIVLQQMVQRWGTIENADTVFAIEIVSKYKTYLLLRSSCSLQEMF